MRISKQVRVLRIVEAHTTIYPTLIMDEHDTILIDAGFPTSFEALKKAMEEEGVAIEQITKIYLTHQDWDHIGCVNTIRQYVPQVKVYAHLLEKPFIEGKEIPIKVAKLKTDGKLEKYEQEKQMFEPLYCKVDEALTDNENLGNSIKIKVIHTPGHTVGHCVFYLPEVKVMIAGDALYNEDGVLINSKDKFTQDKELTKESLKKLVELPIDIVVCYHGGLYTGNIRKRLEEIIM